MNSIATTTSLAPSAAVTRAPLPAVSEVRPVSAVAAKDNLSKTSDGRGKASESANTPKASTDDIQRATDDLRQRVETLAPELAFSVDDTTGRTVITFTDRKTNEVIRQFPSEDALALTRAMDQYQRGLLLNRKV